MGKLGPLHMAVGNVKLHSHLEKSLAFAQKDKHRVFKKTQQFHSMNILKRIENMSAHKLVYISIAVFTKSGDNPDVYQLMNGLAQCDLSI